MQTKSFLKILLLTVFSVVLLQGCKKKTDDLNTSKTTNIIDDPKGIIVSVKHSMENGEFYINAELFQNPYIVSSEYIKTTGYRNTGGYFEIFSNGSSTLENGDYTLTPISDQLYNNTNTISSIGYMITFTGVSSNQKYVVAGSFETNLPADTGFGSPRRHAIFINKTGNTYTITK